MDRSAREEYFANDLESHLTNLKVRVKRHGNSITWEGAKEGITYTFEAESGNLFGSKIKVFVGFEGEEFESFADHMRQIQDKRFWKNEKLGVLRERMEKHGKILTNLNYSMENGEYVIEGKIRTGDDEEAFHAVYNRMIRPVSLYHDRRTLLG